MKKKQISILISIICIIAFTFVTTSIFLYRFTNANSVNPPDLSDRRYFIAHATGSIGGYVYMNCLESLINSLENGYQYIEVDLDYTADSVIVCVHDWEDFNKSSIPGISWRDSSIFLKIPTYEEFKQRKIYGRYTPLSLNDVISIQHRHPFTIVTDRISNTSALNSYFDKEIRNSVMVEAFSEEDYYSLKADGYTPMLSLQLIPNIIDCFDFVLRHAINNNIEWIVVDYHSSQRGLRLLKKLFNIRIAAYTVNLPSYFYQHLGNDIDLVYTDNWNLKTQLNNYQNWTTR
jgi:hypothetical protein